MTQRETRPPTLLVVDDDLITQRLVAFTLKPLGIVVIGADCAEQALAVAPQQPLDIILMDINLPGTDGFQLIQLLRALPGLAEVPFLIFTARNYPTDENRARSLGAEGFLFKPFIPLELRQLVEAHLNLTHDEDAVGK